MKEIIEKWAKSYMRNECVTEDQAQETQEDLSNIMYGLAWHEKDKQEAMEKQPTEYEYTPVKSVFDLDRDIMNSHEYGEVDINGKFYPTNGECETVSALTRDCLYHRIPLTAEQLHERKVEELAKVIKCVATSGIIKPLNYEEMAKSALEWMESKGR